MVLRYEYHKARKPAVQRLSPALSALSGPAGRVRHQSFTDSASCIMSLVQRCCLPLRKVWPRGNTNTRVIRGPGAECTFNIFEPPLPQALHINTIQIPISATSIAFASLWRTLVLILSSHRTSSDFRIARTSAEAASWYRGQLPGYPFEPRLTVSTNHPKCSDQYEYKQGRRVHCAQLYATPSQSGEASVVDGVELSAGQLRPNANHHF